MFPGRPPSDRPGGGSGILRRSSGLRSILVRAQAGSPVDRVHRFRNIADSVELSFNIEKTSREDRCAAASSKVSLASTLARPTARLASIPSGRAASRRQLRDVEG